MPDQSITPEPQRRGRAGKRSQRAKRAAYTDPRLTRALALLDSVKANQFAAEHDPDGIWGLSGQGKELAEQAGKLICELMAAGAAAAAQRADRRLGDFWKEYSACGYVTERAENFFDEAVAELRAAAAPNSRAL